MSEIDTPTDQQALPSPQTKKRKIGKRSTENELPAPEGKTNLASMSQDTTTDRKVGRMSLR